MFIEHLLCGPRVQEAERAVMSSCVIPCLRSIRGPLRSLWEGKQPVLQKEGEVVRLQDGMDGGMNKHRQL